MPVFNNCQYGLIATNNSRVYIDKKTSFYNSGQIAVGIQENSVLYAVGPSGASGASGSTLNIVNSVYGVQVSSSSATVYSANIQNSQVGISCFKGSRGNFDYSTINGPGITNAQSYGFYIDENSTATAYASSVSGYISGTGSTNGAYYKSTNNSVLFVGATTQQNETNVQGSYSGYVIVDTTLGNKEQKLNLIPSFQNQFGD